MKDSFANLPPFAAWQHRDARSGFEVVFLRVSNGLAVTGHTTAVESGEAWAVRYAIELDPGWVTRRGRITSVSARGERQVTIEADGRGSWRVDGKAAPHLEGCLDIDLESSSFTNAFPTHRLGLAVDQEASAPAAYVRALDLSVERLEQRYIRVADDGDRRRFDYSAPSFAFSCRLVYDSAGLVLDYPGIATRAA